MFMKRLNATVLKIIAMISMVLDHTGIRYFHDGRLFRFAGRIAMPLYAFFISESVYYTRLHHSEMKHALRLLATAVLAEVPYDLFFSNTIYNPNRNNVIFTLLIGYLVCVMIHRFANPVAGVLILAAGCWTALHFSCSYRHIGVLLITAFDLIAGARRKWPKYNTACDIAMAAAVMTYAGYYIIHNAGSLDRVVPLFFSYNYSQLGALIALPLLYCYDGTPGSRHPLLIWIYRLFYPLHLSLLLVMEHLGII